MSQERVFSIGFLNQYLQERPASKPDIDQSPILCKSWRVVSFLLRLESRVGLKSFRRECYGEQEKIGGATLMNNMQRYPIFGWGSFAASLGFDVLSWVFDDTD